MNRRELLIRGATAAGAVGLAGCTEHVLKEAESQPPLLEGLYDEEAVDLPTRQKFDVAERAVREADERQIDDSEAFRAFLEDGGLAVESTETIQVNGETHLELAYVDEQLAERGTLYGLGYTSGGYAALLENDAETDELAATIHDRDGRKFGTFHVDATASEEYLDERISAATYAKEVAKTLEGEP